MSSQTQVSVHVLSATRSVLLLTLQSALTTATFAVAQALDNRAIGILGCVMTCLLILVWMAVFIMMIRAVVEKDILWPQKQEDRAEGGWQKHPEEKQACDPRRCSTDPPVPNNMAPPRASDGTGDGSDSKDLTTDSGFEDGSAHSFEHDGDALSDHYRPTEAQTAAERLVDKSVRGNKGGENSEHEMAENGRSGRQREAHDMV